MINIVLVEPEIPQNAGNIVRTCAATGCNLYMVKPLGFELDDKKYKRAGLDYFPLSNIKLYNSIDEIFAENKEATFYFASTKSKKTYADVKYPDGCFVVFGKETIEIESCKIFFSHTNFIIIHSFRNCLIQNK